MLDEFNALYNKKQKEGLTPDEERRFFELLQRINSEMIREKLEAANIYINRIKTEAEAFKNISQLAEAARSMVESQEGLKRTTRSQPSARLARPSVESQEGLKPHGLQLRKGISRNVE